MRFRISLLSVFLVFAAALCSAADDGKSAKLDETATTQPATMPSLTSRPATGPAAASQPDYRRVLVRLGDKMAVTQGEFEYIMSGIPVGKYESYKNSRINDLLGKKMFILYVADHPELVDEGQVEKEIEKSIKKVKLKDEKAFEERLIKFGTTMEEFRGRIRHRLAMAKLVGEAIKKGQDEAYLKELFDADSSEFDGTRVEARHIMKGFNIYDTPQQLEARKQKLAKIRQDLVSGKRTWEECLEESDARTKFSGGNMGPFPRHLRLVYGEPVAEAAFKLKIGEFSDIVKGPMGFHIIQVTKRIPGTGKFDQDVKRRARSWLQKKVLYEAADEVKRKYPIIGVSEPIRPAFLQSMFDVPDTQPTSQPTRQSATRPG
ncbi:MAG: peptidylprolyl isomerase [Planctomycetota bacterium]|nr:MAG: peptidylprolyl isomerase [Planctomycetota bacterium]